MSDETIRSGYVKTRKAHRCVFCWAVIPKGDRAFHWVGVYDCEFQANHAHPECQESWTDDGGEEFTPGDYPVPERIREALRGSL